MDDLQDAIQDAQYIGEMCDPAPRPTKPLDLPTREQAEAYVAHLKSQHKDALGFEDIMSQPLGYYLFARYLRSKRAYKSLQFVEDVAAYSAIAKPELRLRKAGDIAAKYLREPVAGDALDDDSVVDLEPSRVFTPSVLFTRRDGTGSGVPQVVAARLGPPEMLNAIRARYRKAANPKAPLGVYGDLVVGLRRQVEVRVKRRLSAYGYLETPHSLQQKHASPTAVVSGGAGNGSGAGGGHAPADPRAAAVSGTPLTATEGAEGAAAGGAAGAGTGAGAGAGDAPGGGAGDEPTAAVGAAGAVGGSGELKPADEGGASPVSTGVAPSDVAVSPRTADAPDGSTRAAEGRDGASARAFPLKSAESIEDEDARRAVTSPAAVAARAKRASAAGIREEGTDDAAVGASGGDAAEVKPSAYDAAGGAGGGAGGGGGGSGGSSGGGGPRGPLRGQVSHEDSLPPLPSDLFDDLRDAVVEGLVVRHFTTFLSSREYVQFCQFKAMEGIVPRDEDFALFRILGRGGFGAVNGCKKCNTGKLYAMKMLNKKRIKSRSAEALCLNERRVLAMVHSPFVVQLKYAYQTKEDLVLILDICTGGDLAFHLAREERFSEDRARFYAAEVLLGLEHLHSLGIVYRDLKPENILLDGAGHARISDMGLATFASPTLTGRCGTRGYWAPEMLVRNEDGRRTPYGFGVDLWSFGCVLYELLYGKCPFRTEAARALDPTDRHKSMDLATLEMTPKYDARWFSDDARDLLQGLLTRDPLSRLGANGIAEIKRHPFFESLDWGLLATRQLSPPFVPEQNINAASQDAIGMFDETKKVSLMAADQERYAGWEAVNAVAFQQEIVEYLSWEEVQGPITPVMVGDGCCTIL